MISNKKISGICLRNDEIVSDGARRHILIGEFCLGWLAKTRTLGFKIWFLSGKYLEKVLGMIEGARRCRVQPIVWQSGVNGHVVLC